MPSFCPKPPFSIRSTTRRDKFCFPWQRCLPGWNCKVLSGRIIPLGKAGIISVPTRLFTWERIWGDISAAEGELDGFMDVRTTSKQKEL